MGNSINATADGLQDFDASSGDFTGTSLTTKGDLLGFDGTNHERFPVGSDGQLLTADSTQSLGWRWADQGCSEFIDSISLSGAASGEFTSFVDDDCYAGYRIGYINGSGGGTTVNHQIQFSINNGSSYLSSNYQFTRVTIRNTPAPFLIYPGSSSASSILTNGVAAGSNSVIVSGEILLYPSPNPSTGMNTGLIYTSFYRFSGGTLISRGSGSHPTTSAVNGIRFSMTGGTISGNYFLYGLLKE